MANINNNIYFSIDVTGTDLIDLNTKAIKNKTIPYLNDGRSIIKISPDETCAISLDSWREIQTACFNNIPRMPTTITYLQCGNQGGRCLSCSRETFRVLQKQFIDPASRNPISKVYLFCSLSPASPFTHLFSDGNISSALQRVALAFSLEVSHEANMCRAAYILATRQPNSYNQNIVSLCSMILMGEPTYRLALETLTDMCRDGGRDAQIDRAAIIKILAQALLENPQNDSLLTCLGELCRTGGEELLAQKYLEEVLHHNPCNAQALSSLGEMLIGQKGALKRAILLLEMARKANPNNVSILLSLGLAYSTGGDNIPPNPELALPVLEEAFKLNPQNVRVLLPLAELYKKGGEKFKPDICRAIELLQYGLKLNPGQLDILVSLADAFRTGGGPIKPDLREARRLLEEGLLHNPGSVHMLTIAGDLYLAEEHGVAANPGRACELFEAARKEEPRNVDILIRLGKLYRSGKGALLPNPELSHARFEFARRVAPNNVEALLNLGQLYRTGSRGVHPHPLRACALLEHAHRLEANNVEVMITLGSLYFEGGPNFKPNVRKALEILTSALNQAPNHARLLATISEIYITGGSGVPPDALLAKELLERARKLDPSCISTLLASSYLYFLGGKGVVRDLEKSLQYLQQAYRLEPNNPELLACYGAFLANAKDSIATNPADARVFLEQALAHNPYNVTALLNLIPIYYPASLAIDSKGPLAMISQTLAINPYNVSVLKEFSQMLMDIVLLNPDQHKNNNDEAELRGKINQASEYLKAALLTNPYDIQALLALAHLNLMPKPGIEQNLNKALGLFEEAHNINPEDPLPLINLLDYYQYMKHQKIPKRIIACIEETLGLHKNNAQILVDFAPYYYLGENGFPHDVQKAQEYLTQACRLNPHHEWAHLRLGMIYLNLYAEKGSFQNDFPKIEAQLSQALRENRNNKASFSLGELYHIGGLEHDPICRASQANLEKLVTENPNNVLAQVGLGLYCLHGPFINNSKYDTLRKAKQYFESALHCCPDHVFLLLRLGYIYKFFREEDPQPVIEKAFQKEPNNFLALFALGDCLLGKGCAANNKDQRDTARRYLEQALATEPNYLPALLSLTLLFTLEGIEKNRVEALLTQAYQIDPEMTRIYCGKKAIPLPHGMSKSGNSKSGEKEIKAESEITAWQTLEEKRDEKSTFIPEPRMINRAWRLSQATKNSSTLSIIASPLPLDSGKLVANREENLAWEERERKVFDKMFLERFKKDRNTSFNKEQLADFQKATELCSHHAQSLLAYGLCLRNGYDSTGINWKKIQELYNAAVREEADNPYPLACLGDLLRTGGGAIPKQIDKAQELLEKALMKDSDHFISLLSLGALLKNERHDSERADELFARAAEHDRLDTHLFLKSEGIPLEVLNKKKKKKSPSPPAQNASTREELPDLSQLKITDDHKVSTKK
jgi:TPR repeat protein